MDESLFRILQRLNPQIDRPADQPEIIGRSLPKHFLPRRRPLGLHPGKADLVIGPRQTGKSTWIREALTHRNEPVLVLNAEEPRIRELCRSPALALAELAAVLTDETILVIEEVQHLKEAALFIKGLVDLEPKKRIAVTGSASFQLRSHTRESLAGRARRTRLLPFSLEELEASVATDPLPAVREDRLAALWRRLLIEGGYPGVWFDPEPQVELHHLVETFVLRDASDLHTIERPDAFRKLLELAAADIGNLANLNQWAATAEVSRTLVARYIEIASQAHVLELVPPFRGGRRAEVTQMPKVFFIDNGLRNALFGGFEKEAGRADRGALWENAVFGELLKRTDLLDQVFYWRTRNGAEVDFVVKRRGRLGAIEVKAGPLGRPSITRASRSFLKAYQPRLLCVINATLEDRTEIEGVPVLFCRPWEMAAFLDALDE